MSSVKDLRVFLLNTTVGSFCQFVMLHNAWRWRCWLKRHVVDWLQVRGRSSVQSVTRLSSTNITWQSTVACTAARNRSDVNIASRHSVILAPFHNTWRTSTSTASHRQPSHCSHHRCWWWRRCQRQPVVLSPKQLRMTLTVAATCLQVPSLSTCRQNVSVSCVCVCWSALFPLIAVVLLTFGAADQSIFMISNKLVNSVLITIRNYC